MGIVRCCTLSSAGPITPRAGKLHFGPREGECTLGQGSRSTLPGASLLIAVAQRHLRCPASMFDGDM